VKLGKLWILRALHFSPRVAGTGEGGRLCRGRHAYGRAGRWGQYSHLSISDAALLRPLPYHNSCDLVRLYETEDAPGKCPILGPDFVG